MTERVKTGYALLQIWVPGRMRKDLLELVHRDVKDKLEAGLAGAVDVSTDQRTGEPLIENPYLGMSDDAFARLARGFMADTQPPTEGSAAKKALSTRAKVLGLIDRRIDRWLGIGMHHEDIAPGVLEVFRHLRREVERLPDEHHWHEIATEGLPPQTGDFWVLEDGAVEQREWYVGVDRSFWLDPFNAPGRTEVLNPERITHWMPLVVPEPTTEDPG